MEDGAGHHSYPPDAPVTRASRPLISLSTGTDILVENWRAMDPSLAVALMSCYEGKSIFAGVDQWH